MLLLINKIHVNYEVLSRAVFTRLAKNQNQSINVRNHNLRSNLLVFKNQWEEKVKLVVERVVFAIKDIGNEIDTKFYGVSLSPMKHVPGK